MSFADREDAGQQLGAALRARGEWHDAIVLGLARGGVAVAARVAEALRVPLDVCLVRKLGVPWQPELALGAIASGGVRVLNEDVITSTCMSTDAVERVADEALEQLERRERAYRTGRPAQPIAGRTVVLVDDGLATGASMRAAVEATRLRGAARVVVAVPVAPAGTVRRLGDLADDVVCVESPEMFFGVGQFYVDFRQTTDAEVVALLRRHAAAQAESSAHP